MSVLKPMDNVCRTVRPFHFHRSDSNVPAEVETPAAESRTESPEGSSSITPAKADPPLKAEDQRLVLSRRISELEATLEEQIGKAKREEVAAREAGRLEGKRDAEKKEVERLKVLEEALEAARSEALRLLEAQRNLAVDISRATLRQILGDQSAFASLVSETAAYWKAKLAGTAIFKVRVSEQDFPDADALHQLREAVGNLEIQTDSELESGGCVFDLQLGEVDASIPVQAARADALLSEHALEGRGE